MSEIPPSVARRLLHRCVSPHRRDEISADLDELFAFRAARDGRRRARRRYWIDVVSVCARARLRASPHGWAAAPPADQHPSPVAPAMLRNYLKIALRNLRKQHAYTFINVFGLAVGLACCLLLFLHVKSELSFDRFHAKADRIYRLETEWVGRGRGSFTDGVVGPELAATLPEVEAAVRLARSEHLIRHADRQFYGAKVAFTDPSFFDVFSFRLLRGDARTALERPHSLVLTETLARRYFGDEDPVGRTVRVDNADDYVVTGVLEDVPSNSHYRFDALGSFETLPPKMPWIAQRGSISLQTYVLLAPGAAAAGMDARLDASAARHYDTSETTHRLRPLTSIHLHSDTYELEPQSDVRAVYLFTTIALFILFIACINYVNLATARSVQRMKEVGLRKVMGARRSQLVLQFLGESVLLALFALTVAIVLVAVSLEPFGRFTGRPITTGVLRDGPLLLLVFAAGCLGVGVLAGTYPAFYLTRFAPAAVLKGTFRGGRTGASFRKVLVVVQFVVSIALLASTTIVFEQLRYLRSRDLGFDRAHVVNVHVRDPQLLDRAELLRQRLLNEPSVAGATISSSAVGEFMRSAQTRPASDVEGEHAAGTGFIFTDPAFVPTMGLEVLAGRNFSADAEGVPTDVVITAEAARQYGWADPHDALGQPLVTGMFETPVTVIGVVNDFHVRSLHSGVVPLMLLNRKLDDDAIVSVRLRPGDPAAAVARIETLWRGLVPEWPFEFRFLDQEIDRRYRQDRQTGQLFGLFAGLAILVGCLGLFGLAAFTAEQRTKEIGVRKVLGASVSQLVFLLSRDLTRLVLVAFVVAAPLAYLGMERWLDDFAYRITPSPAVFVLCGLAAFAVAFATVGYQAVRAALTDPVRTLRYE